eukprot:CAMPEP_0198212432 /NCGR_PEP_ID=MMETSP1445-20131203/26015_1 /TAXON_ID=36898 /ORGANISM="Pyramimonas sp., Strain CCMP2087" /LENGTH=284 /DNA_ID=CAMNT_0043886869 /DNA_START=230 /DNA_END=1084 /DNA_ORIENTATION=+
MADTRIASPALSICSSSSSTRAHNGRTRIPMAARSHRSRPFVVHALGVQPGLSSVGPNCKLVYTKKCLEGQEGDACTPVVEEILETQTDFIAETLLPTHRGDYRVRAYRHWVNGWPTEPLAIIYGDVEGLAEVPVRVHDACFTSEVLGSMKCDCSEQLDLALEYIQEAGSGMVVYLQQEGRGIGLANKISAYARQEKGLDTVDANRALGFPDDCREYSAVANMLKDLNLQSIRLMTNNPMKMKKLAELGVNVVGRIPCIIKSNDVNDGYLKAKADRMDHMLDHL